MAEREEAVKPSKTNWGLDEEERCRAVLSLKQQSRVSGALVYGMYEYLVLRAHAHT